MQNICSLSKCYLSFPNDDSWNFDKILNVIFMLLYKYLIFPLFWLTLISYFSILRGAFFCQQWRNVQNNNDNNNNNNQCQKFPKKTFLRDFDKRSLKINLRFWKKAVQHTTTLTHCMATQVLCNLLSTTNEGNDWGITFVAGATVINLKYLKTSYDLMTCCRKQSEDINYIAMEQLNLWQILAEVLLELIS